MAITDENKIVEEKRILLFKLGEYILGRKIFTLSNIEERLEKEAGINKKRIRTELGVDKELYDMLQYVENNIKLQKNKKNKNIVTSEQINIKIYYESYTGKYIFSFYDLGDNIKRNSELYYKYDVILPPAYSREKWSEKVAEAFWSEDNYFIKKQGIKDNDWYISEEDIYFIPKIREIVITKEQEKTECVFFTKNEYDKKYTTPLLSQIWDEYEKRKNEEIAYELSELDNQYIDNAVNMYDKFVKEGEPYRGHKRDSILDTDNLNKIFYSALWSTKERILISSPWLGYKKELHSKKNQYLKNSDYVRTNYKGDGLLDDYFTSSYEYSFLNFKSDDGSFLGDCILNLLEKGKEVIILFGYENTSADFGSLDALDLISNDNSFLKYWGNNLKFYHRFGNHQKMILKDNDALILASYNFLSSTEYSKRNNDFQRYEMGYITHDKAVVESEWKKFEDEKSSMLEVNPESGINDLRNKLKEKSEKYHNSIKDSRS